MSADAKAQAEIRAILEAWASATREGREAEILARHAPEAMIYDALEPLFYAGIAAYRRSWGEWAPETQGEAIFALEDLVVEAGEEVAFAYGLLRCGGVLAGGREFHDLVRVSFGLRRGAQGWRILHQHVSKPFARPQ